MWLVVSGSPAVFTLFVFPRSHSRVSPSGWACPAVELSSNNLPPSIAVHLSHGLSGGVRLFGRLHFICFPSTAIHLSPSLSGGVRLSGGLRSSHMSHHMDIHLSPRGWWCPTRQLSSINLSPSIAIHLSPSPALRLSSISLPPR